PFYFIIIGTYLLNIIDINFKKLENNKEFSKRLKKLFIPLIIGAVLTVINPYGIKLLMYPFQTLSNDFINSNIAEFAPTNIANNIGILYMAFIIILFIKTDKKLKLTPVFLFLGTMFMSLLAIRNTALLIIVSVTCLGYIENVEKISNTKNTKDIRANKIAECCAFLVVYSSITIGFLMIKTYSYLPKETYPVEAVKYIKENISRDKVIFNNYEWGSLMMLNDISVFIDSRCDLYTTEYNKGVSVAKDYISIIDCREDYKKLLEKYKVDYIFVKKNTPIAKNTIGYNEYKIVYEDDISYIIELVK
ncbi:MAG: hypothetical protein RSA08_04005, partial [Clostridia bacterium]